MVVTVPPHAALISEVIFTWPGHPFTSNISVHVIVRDLHGSGTCAGLLARSSQRIGYGIYVCADSRWEIDRYDATGTSHFIQQGDLPSYNDYDVAFTLTRARLQVFVNYQPVADVTMDSDYVDTTAIPLVAYNANGLGGSSTFLQFECYPAST
jgi:hypothetical protein